MIAWIKKRWICFKYGHVYMTYDFEDEGIILKTQCFYCFKKKLLKRIHGQ